MILSIIVKLLVSRVNSWVIVKRLENFEKSDQKKLRFGFKILIWKFANREKLPFLHEKKA
jgi:hypothetical protein